MFTAAFRAQFRLQSKELISQTLTTGKRGRQMREDWDDFAIDDTFRRL